MLCVKCGQKLSEDAKLCKHCGTVVGAASQAAFSAFAAPTFTPPLPPGRAAGATLHSGATPAPAAQSSGHVPGLVARVREILVHPSSEWGVIASEQAPARDIYLGYVAPLAAIGIVASFLASAVIGMQVGPVTVRTSIAASLAAAVLTLLATLAGVHLLARFADRMVPIGGQKDRLNALRVVAYSLTPAWLAQGLTIVPQLADFAALGAAYGTYLLYVGLPVLMRCRPGFDALAYALIVALAAAVVNFALVLVVGFASGAIGAGAATLGPGVAGPARIAGATGTVVGRLVLESRSDDRARAMDALGSLPGLAVDVVRGTKQDRDPFDQAVAALAVIAAGGKKVDPVDVDALAALLPSALAGLPRTETSGGPESHYGLQGTVVRATYETGGSRITLEIGDMGDFAGAARTISWFDPTLEKTSDLGYRRTYRMEGNYVREEYLTRDRTGSLAMMVADRFVIAAKGSAVEPRLLLESVRAVDAVKLARLAN